MKQVKKAYKECRAKLPNRPPNEIDFGLGFRAALRWTLPIIERLGQEACYDIEKELGDETKKN